MRRKRITRLQNSLYFCVFKYARAVKLKVWSARKTLTPHFTDFFTDFEKKKQLFCSLEDYPKLESAKLYILAAIKYQE